MKQRHMQFREVTILLAVLLLAVTGSAAAMPPPSCGIFVRLLSGTGRAESSTAHRLHAGEKLSDLTEQLAPLPFAQFEVLDQRQATLRCGREELFSLTGSQQSRHVVHVKLENVVRDGAMLLVHWKDSEAHELLSSKVHLVNNRNWVFGSDTSEDSSTIVSIRVDCGEKHD